MMRHSDEVQLELATQLLVQVVATLAFNVQLRRALLTATVQREGHPCDDRRRA
jgi:hypothetical protein